MEYNKEIRALFGLIKGQGSFKFGKEDYEAIKDASNFISKSVKDAKSNPKFVSNLANLFSNLFIISFVLFIFSFIAWIGDLYKINPIAPGDFLSGMMPLILMLCFGCFTAILAVIRMGINLVFGF